MIHEANFSPPLVISDKQGQHIYVSLNTNTIYFRLLALITKGGENLATKPNVTHVKGKYGTAQFVANLTPKMKAREKYLDDLHEAMRIEREENPNAHVNHYSMTEQMKNH